MKTILITLGVVFLAGCASTEEQEETTQDLNQSVRDFIELRNLESIDAIVSGSSDSWNDITEITQDCLHIPYQ